VQKQLLTEQSYPWVVTHFVKRSFQRGSIAPLTPLFYVVAFPVLTLVFRNILSSWRDCIFMTEIRVVSRAVCDFSDQIKVSWFIDESLVEIDPIRARSSRGHYESLDVFWQWRSSGQTGGTKSGILLNAGDSGAFARIVNFSTRQFLDSVTIRQKYIDRENGPFRQYELCMRFIQRQYKNNKRGECGDNTKTSENVEIPLLPKCPSPKLLFGLAMLTLAGLWLSDYGFTTMKYSEPIAGLIWFAGWTSGVICGTALLLSLANRYL
jgi:hypothetical protein